MTQEQAVIWLLRQRPSSAMELVRSEFRLALSYRRALTMARKRLRNTGETIVLHKAIKRDGAVIVPARYHLETIPGWVPTITEPSGQRRMTLDTAAMCE